jgi:hypothetical protein
LFRVQHGERVRDCDSLVRIAGWLGVPLEDVTTLKYRFAFRDQAGRDHLPKITNGMVANFDNTEDLLSSRRGLPGTVSE